MEDLKATRTPFRRKFTRTLNELKIILDSDNPDEEEVEVKMERMKVAIENLQLSDDKILAKMLADKCSEEEYQAEYDSMDKYRDEWSDFCVKVRRVFHLPGVLSESEAGSSSQSTTLKKNRTYKLPKIEIKKFAGEVTEWISFWSQFEKIHLDEELHDCDKFQYLVQSMVPGSKAAKLVESWPQSAKNYPKVIEAMQDRFGDKVLLTEVYVRKLQQLVISNAGKKNENISLASMYDDLESNLRGLESLGVTFKESAAFLYPMIESGLPIELVKVWQRSALSGYGDEEIKPVEERLTCLMKFIRAEVKGAQRLTFVIPSQKQPEKDKKKDNHRGEGYHKSDVATAAGLFSGHSSTCIFCDKNHASVDCWRGPQMTMKEKNGRVKDRKCCYKCLRSGHFSSNCKAKLKCIICSRQHVVVMCPEVAQKAQEQEARPVDREEIRGGAPSAMTSHECAGDVLLQTLLVRIYNNDKSRYRVARLVFDNGSQGSSVRRDTAEALRLEPVGEVWSRKVLFGGQLTERRRHNRLRVTLSSPDGNTQRDLEVLDEPEICGRLRRIPKGPWLEELAQNRIMLSDMKSQNPEIEVLVGSDYFGQLMTGRVVQLACGLTAMESVFGWTLSGKLPAGYHSTAMLHLSSALMSCQSSVSELWSLETLGIMDPVDVKNKDQELETKKHFLNTVTRTDDGRYSVKLPWIGEAPPIPSNRMVAEKRLMAATTKLKAADQYDVYDGIFKQWIEEGIVEEVSGEDLQENGKLVHYLPHRPVFKPDSLTTPVRPVFDASCKMSRNPSLNECLQKGPNLLELIPSILMRFRERRIGVISDIRKAFQMIAVDPADRDFLRFLWWESPGRKEFKVLRHSRVVFGVNCSPFLLAAVIEYHLKSASREYSAVALKLLQSLYVDNCVTSVDTMEEYEEFKEKSVHLLEDAKMDLRQWEVSSAEGSSQPLTTVLGLKWNKNEDILKVEIPREELPVRISKRVVLSQVQKIYDPLGFLSPATLIPKLLLQKIWKEKSSWDAELEEDVKKEFLEWWSEVPDLDNIHIPRHVCASRQERCQIHTFSDASQFAYAAIVFLRVDLGDEVSVQLIQTKSRVAPIKKVTIPRLELLGCTIASRLTASVKKALSMEDVPTYFWSDSTTAIAWIRRNDEWGTFVGNRVKEICTLSQPKQWSHVPGGINPADLLSRGCSPSKLVESRWWEGPDWLKGPAENWPAHTEKLDENAINFEKKKAFMSSVETVDAWYVKRYSSYMKNIRHIAYLLRFGDKCRKRSSENGKLTKEEINRAEVTLVQLVQREEFPMDQKVICGLRVVKNIDGILCVKTKLLNRMDSEHFRLPILMPNDHPMVEQLIRWSHAINGHAGVQFLMGSLRESFWIIQARKAIRRVIGKCVTCRRFTAKSGNVTEAALPENRVKTAAVFQITGVDLAGPLTLTDGSKTWFVIFTCAVYRAIHLELVTSISTDSFLLALFRFVSRRGRPTTIYSDNGTNFVGADNLFRKLDWKRIEAESQVQRIQWLFNPPTASWWGGFWERLIRNVKDLLKRVLGHKKLNYDQLLTCLCEVEAVVNGRPLTFVNEDQDDLIPLTPAMFIQDITVTEFPEVAVLDGSGLRRQYEKLKTLRVQLRNRFRKEYLALLVHKGKMKKEHKLEVGDLVLIGADNKKRLDWPMGRIVEFLGKDQARVAKVKTMGGMFLRPVQRLYPLEISSSKELPAVTPEVTKTARLDKESAVQKLKETEPGIATRFGRKVRRPVN